MKYEELAPGIFVFDDVLEDPISFVNDIKALIENDFIPDWKDGFIIKGKGKALVDRSHRYVNCITLEKYDIYPDNKKFGATYLIHEFLDKNLLPYLEKYSELNEIPVCTTKEAWSILKYEPGHFFAKHQDHGKKIPRTVSMIYYPNDDYEGGELEFFKFNLKIKPKANQVIFFPSNYVYTHQVHKVISGFRYAVVNWWDL